LSNEPPSWWTEELRDRCIQLANRAYPNEACGLIVSQPEANRISLHELRASASPVSFFADPAEVVRFAYAALAQGWRVVGTFHSHPNGRPVFSERDQLLLDWADHHVLTYRSGGTWGFAWGMKR
jgi:proteasome lid subunit RPN8/RPN11